VDRFIETHKFQLGPHIAENVVPSLTVTDSHVLVGIYQVEDDAQAEGKATEAADSAGLVVSSERQSSGRERTRGVLPFGVPRGARSWE